MAPVVEAIQRKLVKSSSTTATYQGKFDQEWLVGAVPNGGYSLGIVSSCVHDYLKNQLRSSHTDLFHVSSTYLNATDSNGGWILELQVTKAGKGFTNIDANLTQKVCASNASSNLAMNAYPSQHCYYGSRTSPMR
jgi:hypothetical protein